MTFVHKDLGTYKLFAHKDASFINNHYYTPIDVLVQMDSDSLRHSLARAKLVCRWLEGILEFTAELDAANPDKRGK